MCKWDFFVIVCLLFVICCRTGCGTLFGRHGLVALVQMEFFLCYCLFTLRHLLPHGMRHAFGQHGLVALVHRVS
jgi:hypothetical protein